MDREPRYSRSPPESQQFNEKQQGSRRDNNVFGKLSTNDLVRPRAVNNGRKRTTLACQECRYRKVKCDGIKPMCGSCRRRGRQFTCSYLVSPEEKARNIFGYVDQLEKTLLDFQKETQDILISNDETRLLTQPSPSGESTTSYNHPDGSNSGDQHPSRKRRRCETASQFKGVLSGRRSQHEGPLSSDDRPVQASSAFDSTSTDHFMEKVQRVSMNADQSTSPPMDDRSVSGTSGYFRDNFEEQVAKKPSILSRADDYGKSMRSRHTMQTLLTAYWDRVHILHPILHRPTWPGKQKAEVFVHGFTTTLDPSNSSTVATIMTNLVFALGALYSPGFTTAHALNTSEAFFLSAKDALTLDLLETPTVELAQTLLLMTHYVVERCNHQRGHLHASLLYLSLAIRVCTALGFHEDSGASKGPLTREIGRRIWWECIYTDITLSTHYGQPLLLPNSNYVLLPVAIEDRFISNDRMDEQLSGGTSKLTFFIKAMELIQIVRDIKEELYGHRQGTRRSYQAASDTGDYRALKSLQSRLLSWHAALPPELVYPMTSDSQPWHFFAQSLCLYLRYQYASMLIYRPALSSLLESEPDSKATGDRQIGMGSAWQQTLVVQHARSCVAVAVDYIYKIHGLVNSRDEYSIFHGHTWTFFYLYSMISVLIATKCCRQELYPRDDFREAWKQVTNILRRYRTSSNLVEIPFRFLEHVGRQYFDGPSEQEATSAPSKDQAQVLSLASSSVVESVYGSYGSTPHVGAESAVTVPPPERALDASLASTSWEPPWTSKMDDKTFELLADPWEAWDLQWLNGFPDLGMSNST